LCYNPVLYDVLTSQSQKLHLTHSFLHQGMLLFEGKVGERVERNQVLCGFTP